MEQIILSINNYIQFFPFRGYEIVFLFTFVEALAFVGALFPGTIVVIAIGFICYKGIWNIALAFIVAILGGLTGDLISYYVGRKKGLDLKLGQKSIFRHLYIKDAGNFLLEGGAASIIIGRFIGPTRPFIPFYMGAAGERERRFIFYDVVGVVLWTSVYLFLGYVFGSSYDLVKQWVDNVTFVVVVVVILIIISIVVGKLQRKNIKKNL